MSSEWRRKWQALAPFSPCSVAAWHVQHALDSNYWSSSMLEVMHRQHAHMQQVLRSPGPQFNTLDADCMQQSSDMRMATAVITAISCA